MRVLAPVLTCLVLIGCQSVRHPSIDIADDDCGTLLAWTEERSRVERVANWDWAHSGDVIAMRAKMSVCSPESCVADEMDRAMYAGLSRYTHSLSLGEFAWLVAECVGARPDVSFDSAGSVVEVEARMEVGERRLEIAYFEDHCAYGDWIDDPGWTGCASFRASGIH
ncbi:hypothetical protein [Maricaulis sp. W15]|uniref:hypothetical protein n=1 Tax=Maricaulis sp. W15 TaxID=1772333 RepID=UPI001180704B|nr:hypothetical protein [Maricaulis sp. W15]